MVLSFALTLIPMVSRLLSRLLAKKPVAPRAAKAPTAVPKTKDPRPVATKII